MELDRKINGVQAEFPDIKVDGPGPEGEYVLTIGKTQATVSADGTVTCENAKIKANLQRHFTDAPADLPRGEVTEEPVDEPFRAPPQAEAKVEAPRASQTQMARGFRKAERRKSKLRLGLCGPAGSGKTMSALLIAGGLVDGDWSKVGLVDTENGSGDLYVHHVVDGVEIGEYNVLPLEAPYEISKYLEAIRLAEEAGLEVLILDSITHAWAGVGGMLDRHGKIADRTGNSWAAWRNVTPDHNRFIDAMLTTKLHLIATMRSKTEYVYESGKVHKVGMAPVQRDGMDYEFTVVFELDQQHNATPTKDRTSLFDGRIFKPSAETGKSLVGWLNIGATA